MQKRSSKAAKSAKKGKGRTKLARKPLKSIRPLVGGVRGG